MKDEHRAIIARIAGEIVACYLVKRGLEVPSSKADEVVKDAVILAKAIFNTVEAAS